MKYRLIILIILIFAFVAGNLHLGRQKKQLAPINTVFPYKIGIWEGKDVKPDESVYKMLDRDELLLRKYQNKADKQIISLAVILTAKRDHVHDPEVCYRGQGLDMQNEHEIDLSSVHKIMQVSAKNSNKQYNMLYWYSDGPNTYPKRVKFMTNVTITRFFDKPNNGFALVVILSDKKSVSKEVILDFANKVNETLNKNLHEF